MNVSFQRCSSPPITQHGAESTKARLNHLSFKKIILYEELIILYEELQVYFLQHFRYSRINAQNLMIILQVNLNKQADNNWQISTCSIGHSFIGIDGLVQVTAVEEVLQ